MAYEKPKYANDDRLWKKADPEKKKLLEVKAKYSDYLFSFPGVFGVGVGLVRKDGQLTHDRAILVMVDINRPPEHRDVIDRIPRQLDGCPVQVEESGLPREVGAVNTRHRSSLGGLQGDLQVGWRTN